MEYFLNYNEKNQIKIEKLFKQVSYQSQILKCYNLQIKCFLITTFHKCFVSHLKKILYILLFHSL